MDSGECKTIIIPPECEGMRLDLVIRRFADDVSRSRIHKLFDDGLVRLDGAPSKSAYRVRGGETLEFSIPKPVPPLTAAPEDIPINTLYEDDDIIVINKSPDMVVHPSKGHHTGSLVSALLWRYGSSLSGIGGVTRPGIVHRLDKDTSGCLVIAKNDAAHGGLMRQFMDRRVQKNYLAITRGVPKPLSGSVEGQIGRNPANRKQHAMLKSGGRHSLSVYETIENYGSLALVRVELKTGRTHQARVHLASLGSPVLCDAEYGKESSFSTLDLHRALEIFRFGRAGQGAPPAAGMLLARQALHAWQLSFAHPVTGAPLAFEAPLPADMLAVLEPLRAARQKMMQES